MIGDEYRRVTTRLKQEEIERVLSAAAAVGSDEGGEDGNQVLLQVFEVTLSMFESQVRDIISLCLPSKEPNSTASQTRIWVQTKLKLAEVFKCKGDWDRVNDACQDIHSRTQKQDASLGALEKVLPTEGGWAQLIKANSDGAD